MAAPFFSIVIPTKNRPGYLAQSLYSALHQEFSDVEVIVSDNYNEASTYEAITPFLSDKRLKYIRTGREMNMIDHWEWCTRQATGKYVVVLPDRKLIYRKGLVHVYEALQQYGEGTQALSFGVNLFDEEQGKMGWNAPIGPTRIFSSEELIRNFLDENYFSAKSLDAYFPKTLNGCFSNAYAKAIRENYGSYFNLHGVTTPDYSSFFINLALNRPLLYIGKPVYLTQGEQISNGRNFGKGRFDAYMNALGLDDPYARVPIKAPFIYNLLVNDFLVVQEKTGGNLRDYTPNIANLFATTRHELEHKRSQGMLDAGADAYFAGAWEKAFALQPEEIRAAADQLTEQRKMLAPMPASQKLKHLPLHIRDFINHRFSHIGWIGRVMHYRFPNALKAAGYKHAV